VVDEKGLRMRIFKAGVEPAIRKEVWKYLLGLYPTGRTAAHRHALLQQRREEYQRIMAQWTSITDCQAKRFASPRHFSALHPGIFDCGSGQINASQSYQHAAVLIPGNCLLWNFTVSTRPPSNALQKQMFRGSKVEGVKEQEAQECCRAQMIVAGSAGLLKNVCGWLLPNYA
jgi:hypothetical protein